MVDGGEGEKDPTEINALAMVAAALEPNERAGLERLRLVGKFAAIVRGMPVEVHRRRAFLEKRPVSRTVHDVWEALGAAERLEFDAGPGVRPNAVLCELCGAVVVVQKGGSVPRICAPALGGCLRQKACECGRAASRWAFELAAVRKRSGRPWQCAACAKRSGRRSEIARKANACRSAEERSASARLGQLRRSDGDRRATARAGAAGRTWEERSASARKAWATRKAKRDGEEVTPKRATDPMDGGS